MTAPTSDLSWPRFDRPEDLAAIEAIPLADRDLPPSTYELLRRAAETWPDAPAVSTLPSAARWQEPVRLTYAELAESVRRIAHVLLGLGIGRGDAVAVLSPNTGAVLAATLAAEAVGIAAPVNPGLALAQVRELLEIAGARVLVVAGPELDAGLWKEALQLARRADVTAVLAIRPDDAEASGPELPDMPGLVIAYLDELAAAASSAELPASSLPAAHDIASYFHTGGSTGTPKVAAHTHANEVTMAWTLAACTGEDAPALFAGLPLFHVNALLVTGLAPLFKGQHVVWAGPLGYRDPGLYEVFWRLVERYRISAMSAVPTVYAALGQVPVDADISSLTFPMVGAAPLPAAVRTRFLEHTGIELCEGYGLTEATAASARSYVGAFRPGTVGQRLPYQQIKAVHIDSETGVWTDLPPGATGVLVISGPTVFPGYVRVTAEGRAPDPTRKVVDGWLDTGDLGSVDTDGFVRLTGRAKDLIIRGGHNIDPAVIEEALLAHPAVTAAAAVGMPDRRVGELPAAYVTLRPGTDVTGAEIATWSADQVADRAAVPQDVHVIDEIPLTRVGKPFKPALRQDILRRVIEAELAAAGLGESVRVTVALEADQVVAVLGSVGGPLPDSFIEVLDSYTFTWRLAED